MEKIRTTVRIAGKEYAMASYDSEAYVQRVASYVDRKMNELALSTRLPAVQLAVLTALNVADDMIKAHDENDRLKRELGRTRDELEAAQAQIKRLEACEARLNAGKA
ncbi:MAG: cell division protein ZapA [Clostridia bacterium]